MSQSSKQSLPLGVVLERRDSRHPWQDHVWKPTAVLPGAPPRDPRGVWSVLQQEQGRSLFHAGTLELTLYRKETEGYKLNLSQKPPLVYVVLRSGADMESDHEVVPFFVTVCPYEAEQYLVSGDETVEGVPMPLELMALVKDYVDRHYEPEAFHKRPRKPYDPRKGGGGRAGGTGDRGMRGSRGRP